MFAKFAIALLPAALLAQWNPELSMKVKAVTAAVPSPSGKLVVWTQTWPVMDGEKRESLTHVFLAHADGSGRMQLTRGEKSAKDVVATAMSVGRRIAKVPVCVGVCYGFVGNRMLHQRGREAEKLILEGALPHEVDKVLTDFGFPMGPFAMGDLAGLDVGHRALALLAPGGRAAQAIAAVAHQVRFDPVRADLAVRHANVAALDRVRAQLGGQLLFLRLFALARLPDPLDDSLRSFDGYLLIEIASAKTAFEGPIIQRA